jgi:Sec-independent protein translocase protein TatA
MEFLGIGPMELVLILIIALIVLGPKDMVKAGNTLGRFVRSIIKSDVWKVMRQASQEFENIPTRLVREAGLDEEVKSIKGDARMLNELGRSIAAEATLTGATGEPARADSNPALEDLNQTQIAPEAEISNQIAPPGIETTGKDSNSADPWK